MTDDALVASWFDAALDAVASAPIAASRRLAVAGSLVQLSASSDAVADVVLAGLVPPVDATADDAGLPVARWRAVDGTRVTLPPPPFGAEDLLPRDGIQGGSTERFRLAWAIERQVLWALDLQRGEGLIWLRDPAGAAPWDRAAPWRPLLAWWLPTTGATLVHAAAVAPPGRPDRGALLVGAGGAGKSTLALACGCAGWTVTADDYLVVAPDVRRGGWIATAPYRWAKADPSTQALLDLPTAWFVPGIDHLGKSLVDLPTAFGPLGAAPIRIVAAVAPRRAPDTGSAQSAHPSAFLAATGPSTVLQTPGDASAVLRILGDVARSTPSWSLAVGPDVAVAGPAALDRLLTELVVSS